MAAQKTSLASVPPLPGEDYNAALNLWLPDPESGVEHQTRWRVAMLAKLTKAVRPLFA